MHPVSNSHLLYRVFTCMLHLSDSCFLEELVSPPGALHLNDAGKYKTEVYMCHSNSPNHVDCEELQCSLVVKLNTRVEGFHCDAMIKRNASRNVGGTFFSVN